MRIISEPTSAQKKPTFSKFLTVYLSFILLNWPNILLSLHLYTDMHESGKKRKRRHNQAGDRISVDKGTASNCQKYIALSALIQTSQKT